MDKPEYPLWYEGYEPENKPSILPAGDPKNNHIIKFYIRIINVYGSYAENDYVEIQVWIAHHFSDTVFYERTMKECSNISPVLRFRDIMY